MKKKYLVIGDYVTSKNDGQRHYINCKTLIRLYKVNPKECVCYESSSPSIQRPSGLIILWPRYEGDYDTYLSSLTKNQ